MNLPITIADMDELRSISVQLLEIRSHYKHPQFCGLLEDAHWQVREAILVARRQAEYDAGVTAEPGGVVIETGDAA